MLPTRYKVIIGRNEPVSFKFIDADIQFPAKMDTGAYRSSIHCVDMERKVVDGVEVLSGSLLKGHPCCFGRTWDFVTNEFEEVIIANSFGDTEKRYLIKLQCKLGPKFFKTHFTLTDRSKKLFPILIGREALSSRFLIDSAKTSIDRIELKKLYGAEIPDDEEDRVGE